MSIKPPYIFYIDQFPWRKTLAGLSIWPFIWIKHDESRSEDDERSLIEHEKIHHRQQLRGLLIGFYVKYFYYNWKYGYENNPYELEAYANQNNWKKPRN